MQGLIDWGLSVGIGTDGLTPIYRSFAAARDLSPGSTVVRVPQRSLLYAVHPEHDLAPHFRFAVNGVLFCWCMMRWPPHATCPYAELKSRTFVGIELLHHALSCIVHACCAFRQLLSQGAQAAGQLSSPGAGSSRPDPRHVLCVLLILERARGQESKWAPYLDILPECYGKCGAHPPLSFAS
eukprot:scaffold153946_cov15-Tisochrysis_lutea.AAC.1